MLEIKSLSKSLASVIAVNDVSFTISKPQMVGIIARSGAGKSTLLQMTNRLTEATAGRSFIRAAISLR